MSTLLHRIPVLLHGERPALLDVLLVYAVGVSVGGLIVAQSTADGAPLPMIEAVVLFVLALDVTGGVIANSTQATNRWYQGRPLQIRLLFVAVHFAHPLVAVVVFDPGNWTFFAAVYLYMLLAASVVLLLPPSVSQRPVAFALYVIGVTGAVYLLEPVTALLWFVPAYFAKLIVCFAVDHYGTRQHATTAAHPARVERPGHA